jgi:hypothetical protein
MCLTVDALAAVSVATDIFDDDETWAPLDGNPLG